MKLIPITLMLLALLTPAALAQTDWEAVCVGNTLIENVTITVDGDVIPITRNISCSHGCDAGRRQCIDFSGTPGAAVPMVLFIIFELIAFGLLALSFVSNDTIFKLISSVMATILLFSLGLLATNIMTDQGAVQIIWLSWFNIFMGWVGIIMFIAAMFYMFKDSREKLT